ncbi:AraC family transcriptional regulator [Taibaiella lutea]|uniref:AraC family transcriptional regulator n=1 Tax=Taibaiella lutea TaxID=2608001 RepID=A0A5M6CGA5_9BACT|nr:helix-turn-helix domain-containing protein [Taibaiella lutea]KAA5532475.1 AraC family transcriptional regulator [Taibaiella lutea]
MHHQEFGPPEILQDAIKCFWYDVRELGEQQTGFEVVPDGYAEIIFYFGDVLNISSNGNLRQLPSPFMMGLLNQPALFYTKGRFEIIGIRCFPWTVFDLLGLSSGKDGVRTFEHPIAKLQPALKELMDAGRVEEAITQVEQYFLAAHSYVHMDSMLFKAGVAIRETNGNMPVTRLAKTAHTTVRTLERKFKQSSGYTMKDVSGLVRFEQVRNQLWLDPDSNLAGLAHELGYTDQSHLSREFKRYSGATPAAFARNAKKDKQVASSDFVAFIQA